MELKLTHVTKQYGTKTAVDHINMTLREGIYGLWEQMEQENFADETCLSHSKKKRRRNYSGWPGNPGNGGRIQKPSWISAAEFRLLSGIYCTEFLLYMSALKRAEQACGEAAD